MKNKNKAINTQAKEIGPTLNFASKEAYKYLRTNISFTIPDKNGCKFIGITSSIPSEGKTFTSINLAYSLAESGNKVLLVEGDLRRPAISKALKIKPEAGLSDFLSSRDQRIVYKKILHENMDVILSGSIPPNPSELLGSENMEKGLKLLGEQYNYIIVDLPPINAVTDALAVSKFLDGIIVVIRHEYSRKREVLNSINQLEYVGAHILGFVYNGYHQKGSKKAYRYNYNYK